MPKSMGKKLFNKRSCSKPIWPNMPLIIIDDVSLIGHHAIKLKKQKGGGPTCNYDDKNNN